MRKASLWALAAAISTLAATTFEARAGDGTDPEKFFQQRCASCHNETPVPRAMTREAMAAFPPEQILRAVSNGTMSFFAILLNAEDRRRLAAHVSSRPWSDPTEAVVSETPVPCKDARSPYPPRGYCRVPFLF